MTIQKVFFLHALIIFCSSCSDNPINNTNTQETPNNIIGNDTSALSLLPKILATIDINEEFADDSKCIDSLLSIFLILPPFGTTPEGDTSRINILNQLSIGYELTGSYDSAFHYANEAYTLASTSVGKLLKTEDEMLKGKANALYNIGNVHYDWGNYSLAMDFYLKSLAIRKQQSDKKGIADSFNRIGNVYKDQANYPLALDYYQKSLTIREQIGDNNGIAYCFNDIGNVHDDLGNPVAMEYYLKSFNIRNEIGDKRGIADSYNNIGIYYIKEGVNSLALKFYLKSLKIREVFGDKKGIADSYNNIANVHLALGNYPLAMEYNMKSLKIREELADKKGMSYLLANIGNVHQRQGNDSLAMEYYMKALKIKEELGDKVGMSYVFNCMGWLALEKRDYAKAIANCKRALVLAQEIGVLPNENFSRQIIEKAIEEKVNELGGSVPGVHFREFSIFISEPSLDSLLIEFYKDYYQIIQEVQDDTAWLEAWNWNNSEIQKIIIRTDQLINLSIEKCYQRTLSISIRYEADEEKEDIVELNDLIKQNSYWEKIKLNDDGQIINSYDNEIVWEKFPDININELKLKLREDYGEECCSNMSDINTFEELQNSLSINRHFLRITGKRKDNGEIVTKIIVVVFRFGC